VITAYIDCFSGVAGDMLLAALIDAGYPLEDLAALVQTLGLPGVSVRTERVKRHGLAALRAVVVIAADAPRKHRHLSHILKIIDAAELPPRVRQRASDIFRRLAEAEAHVHATSVEKVHFHEVGADDAIVDIVGVCAGLEHFGVQRILASAVPTGSGTVTCDHGVMPVPAPATAQLLRGVPLAACEEPGELTTPTGAAIVATLAESFGPLGDLTPAAIGIGSGTREGRTRPNILRVLIGESAHGAAAAGLEQDTVAVLEAQVDDATGQAVAFAMGQMLEAGALDVFVVPIIMKKGRPGQLVTVLAAPTDAEKFERALLLHTSTIGVRRTMASRRKLARELVTVETSYGAIRIKASRGAGIERATPEYEDCARAARNCDASLADVQAAAMSAYERGRGGRV
jgi:pyridinium-3,5-bisthiocarboxylic acid mononucleotide nickel chelatase